MHDFAAAQDEDFVEIEIRDIDPPALVVISDDPEDEDGMYAFDTFYTGTDTDYYCRADDHWTSEHSIVYILSENEFASLFEDDLVLCVRGESKGRIASRYDIIDTSKLSDDGTLVMGQYWVSRDFFGDYSYIDFGPNAVREPCHIFFEIGD